jgi:hypothetical protein
LSNGVKDPNESLRKKCPFLSHILCWNEPQYKDWETEGLLSEGYVLAGMRDVFGNIVKRDLFGRKRSKKEIKREVLSENKAQGRAGEQTVRAKYAMQGYETERTGRGHDFRARKRDFVTGRVIESKVVEVKTGKAKLSKLQRKTKKRQSNYKVERVQPFHW